MKKSFLAGVLTISLAATSIGPVFATENKFVFKNYGSMINQNSFSLGKVDENKEKNVIVVLKENSSVDFSKIKTDVDKNLRIAATKELRDSFKSKLDSENIKYEVLFEYDFLFAGFALKLKQKDIEKVKKIDLVDSIEISAEYLKPNEKSTENKLDTSSDDKTIDSNETIKVSTELQKKYNGQGRVVAVLDTGIDLNHPILRVSDVSKGKYKNAEEMKSKMSEVGIDYGSWRNDKVVYAHNYNTHGTNVKEDIKEESHGMHVSGTAVGNPEMDKKFTNSDGSKRSEKIIGVAPEAQLIFMGVFNGERTYTHMYAKALEDAVKLGADSVNLSLGAPNGTEGAVGKSMDKAIEYARQMGVIVAIAAGNDGHFGFYGKKPPATNPDYGTLGSPGTSDKALTVAAMNTTIERTHAIKVDGIDAMFKVGNTYKGYSENGKYDDVDFLNQDKEYNYEEETSHNVVYAGLGIVDNKQGIDDFKDINVQGKIALIQRGGINFIDKILNAQANGARGVIIFNHEAGGNEIMNMLFYGREKEMTIPSLFMGHDDGMAMLNKLKENPNTKVTFYQNEVIFPYADGMKPTDFSSYGLTADGAFKPDITAPGGLIYSSINDGKYMSMNGTSMATPHVAGAITIIREAFNQRHPEIKGSEEYDTIKAIMMSTADPIEEVEGRYYTPRKQGSGALNVERAISSDLYVVDNENNPKAYLKNIDSTFSIKLKVKNIGKESRKLKYNTVLQTDAVENGKFKLEANKLEDIVGETITVPANGEKEVVINVDATKYDAELKQQMPNGYFLEGFVFFKDIENENPVVSIPFSGFKGDWASIPLIEKSVYDFDFSKEEPIYFTDKFGNRTGNVTAITALENNPYAMPKSGQGFNFYGKFNEIPLGINMYNISFLKDKIAFSPNKDNNKDFIEFKGVFFRNTQYLNAVVTNDNGEEVFVSGGAYLPKNSNNYLDDAPRAVPVDATAWYGNVGDQILPDGHYKYTIVANSDTPGAQSNVQKMEFDVMLDTVAPVIKTPVVKDGFYTPEITDELSGIESIVLTYIGKDGQMKWIGANQEGKFELPKNVELSKIAIHTFDYAGNITSMNLDGSEYVAPKEEQVEITTGIRPILNITNFKDFSGNHIEGSEKLNMFPVEVNWREKVEIQPKGGDWITFNYIDGKIPLNEGEYGIFISELPPAYKVLNEPFKTVDVKNNAITEVVYTTELIEKEIPAGHGEVNIRLKINDLPDNFIHAISYIIKDKDGNVLDRDNFEVYEKLYNSPVVENDNLTGVMFHRDIMTILPAGEYTAEVVSQNDDLTVTNKSVNFTIEDGKSTVAEFKSTESILDVVNIIFEGLDKLPEGIIVKLEDVNTGNLLEIPKAKLYDKIFSSNIVNGKYKVKIELPDGYDVDRNNFVIDVKDYKVIEKINIRVVYNLPIITDSSSNSNDLANSDTSKDNSIIEGKSENWYKEGDDWRYKNTDSNDVVDAWIKTNNNWYRIDAQGNMDSNEWVKVDNTWYWSNESGRISQNEWIKVDNTWYWANESGRISQNEWVKVDNTWYWSNESGRISQNEWIKVDNIWYWSNETGKIVQNEWLEIKGKWYYFDETGALLVNTTTPDGYKVNSNGEWVKNSILNLF